MVKLLLLCIMDRLLHKSLTSLWLNKFFLNAHRTQMEDLDRSSFWIMQKFMSQELEDRCEEAGVLLARLPPYSCDYNPIETSFALLKRWTKKRVYTAEAYGPEQGGLIQQVFMGCC